MSQKHVDAPSVFKLVSENKHVSSRMCSFLQNLTSILSDAVLIAVSSFSVYMFERICWTLIYLYHPYEEGVLYSRMCAGFHCRLRTREQLLERD